MPTTISTSGDERFSRLHTAVVASTAATSATRVVTRCTPGLWRVEPESVLGHSPRGQEVPRTEQHGVLHTDRLSAHAGDHRDEVRGRRVALDRTEVLAVRL